VASKATKEKVRSSLTAAPASWPTVRFGDVVRDVKATVDRDTTDLTRFIAGEHMGSDDLHLRTWGDINGDYLGPAFHRSFRKGQVLYGSRRTYLKKVVVASFDGICANTTFVLESRDPDVLLPELLPFIMLTDAFTQHSIRESKGSVNPYINWKDIAKYEFPLPPKDEQRRIADILWAADETVEAWKLVRAYFNDLARSLRANLVTEKNIKRIPLGDCLTAIVPGKSVIGRNEPAEEGDLGVLKVSAVGADGFIPKENKTLLDRNDFHDEFAVRSGDLLITRSNTPELVGRVCLVGQDYPNLMLCDKTLRLVPNERIRSKEVLLEILRSEEVRTQIKGFANGTGGAMKNISQSSIRSIRIPVADEAEQLRTHSAICEMARAVGQLDEAIRNANSVYSSLRDGLLRGTNNVH
jgi:type I restriction enzyme S subunit